MKYQANFNQRIKFIFGLLAIAFLICVGRLFQIQIVQHDTYSVKASQEHRKKYTIPASRGRIYALDQGQKSPLALNRTAKRVYADPRYVEHPKQAADKIANILGGNPRSYQQKLSSNTYYVVLAEDVSRDKVERIKEQSLAGVGIADIKQRVYPEDQLASHILGYVNNDGQGQYGIEQFYNDKLQGTPGLLNAKTDVRGIPIATADNVQIEPKPGQDVILSIDRNIQAKVESALKEGMREYQANSASAIVMDPNTGRIKAMANYPTFNPADYGQVEDYGVFQNQAATGLYEPGSMFKIFTMSTGLDTRAVKPDDTYEDKGYAKVDNYRIFNAGAIQPKTRSMTNVITKSVNTGVIHVLRSLSGDGDKIEQRDQEILYDYLTEHFGLGQKTGVEVPGEPKGEISRPGQSSNSNYANMTFGQGLTATPLQVAASVSAVANGGTYFQPTLVDHFIKPSGEVVENKPKVVRKNIIGDRTQKQMIDMLETVVESGGGWSARIPGYNIAGKTSTAQISNPEGGYFENRDIGSFVGFTPAHNAQHVIIVRFDQPQVSGYAGSMAAAPVFAEINDWLVQYEAIPPQE